jgi:hypothetical protein
MNPNPTYYKRVKLAGNRTAFMFDNLDDYNKFIEDVDREAVGNTRIGLDRINQPNYVERSIRSNGISWYGTDDPNSVKGNLTTYLFNNELQSFLETFRNQTVNIDVIDIDQQKAIKFTDREIGIFSFDLASLGLIRVYEYYSLLLNKIVSPNLVKSQKGQDGSLVFYHVYTPFVPAHKVSYDLKQGGYYSTVLKRVVQKSELVEIVTDTDIYFEFPERKEIQQHVVERIQQKDSKGREKFSSTFKKSFIYIPKVEKSLPRIDIIVGASYSSSINAQTQMIYSSMAAIAIAEKLSKSGVNYRIVASYPVETTGGGTRKKVFTFVTVKKEGEPFDRNKIAILLSDGRQFRFQQFKGFLASMFDAGYDSSVNPSTIGSAIYDADLVKDAYMEYLGKQDNPDERAAAQNPQSKIVFNGALNEAQARQQYNNIIRTISKL